MEQTTLSLLGFSLSHFGFSQEQTRRQGFECGVYLGGAGPSRWRVGRREGEDRVPKQKALEELPLWVMELRVLVSKAHRGAVSRSGYLSPKLSHWLKVL